MTTGRSSKDAQTRSIPQIRANRISGTSPSATMSERQRFSAQLVSPSSSQAASNSLDASIPWKYWWPNSCTVTDSMFERHDNTGEASSRLAPVVMRVGYSIPPAPSAPGGGETTVSCGCG